MKSSASAPVPMSSRWIFLPSAPTRRASKVSPRGVSRVAISDQDVAESHLREQVVPGVSQSPGFVAGYWMRKGDSGLGVVVFESEDAAEEMKERVPSMTPEAVTVEDVEVREVVAHA